MEWLGPSESSFTGERLSALGGCVWGVRGVGGLPWGQGRKYKTLCFFSHTPLSLHLREEGMREVGGAETEHPPSHLGVTSW